MLLTFVVFDAWCIFVFCCQVMKSEKYEFQKYYYCACFTTDNIFLDEYKLHVRFASEQQFRQDFSPINQEVDRRKCFGRTSVERAAAIRDIYQPLHPHVYHLQESFLAPKFKHIAEYCSGPNASKEGLLELLDEVPAPKVYRFPVFERQFCEELLQELEHFEQSAAPKGRPNTMNHYGILLNELHFDQGFITPFRERYLHPITALLYPDWGGHCLDTQKAFVVKYDMNEDLDLSYHYDNAEITLNVSLGKDFTEGNLYFGDMRQVCLIVHICYCSFSCLMHYCCPLQVPLSESECTEVQHKVTEGLLHRGQHMHGALPIASGQRWNLIIWMRASQVRNQLCPMCQRKPSLLEGEGYADGFTCQSDSLVNASCSLA
uniref:2-oxoglutarate and iron-dependent oxygenase domain containing 2 n=1 Tax=Neogobius melanostomus TaxID=47308 RepID=A0A8C6TQQ8_9GOBI